MNHIKDTKLEEMRSATSSEALRKIKRYAAATPVISVKDLYIQFNLRGDILHAIRGVSLDIYKGESLAIVGESGSGKSVFVKSIIGLLDANGSIENGEIHWNKMEIDENEEIHWHDMDLAQLKREEDWEKVRGSGIAMVMQDPMTSLNPLLSVGEQIAEAVRLHQGLHGAAAKEKVYELLTDVGISEPRRRYKQYPHEFSGGMRQRVVIAIALACKPQVLICDEPTTALDVTIQAQILNLLKSLKAKYHLTTIYITHDLGVVANIADRIVVMYAGDFIEYGLTEEIFYDARHPYTWALLSSMPQLGQKGQDLVAIEGTPPNLFNPIVGDAFAPRNKQALKIDFLERPPLFTVSPTHFVRSWLLDERAPHVDPPPLYAEPTAVNDPEVLEQEESTEEGGFLDD